MKKGDAILIMELARGATQNAAAKAAGVSANTVTRRVKDSGFRKRVSELRRQALDIAAGVLAKSSAGAAEVLDALAQSVDEAGHVRRSAARDILDHAMKLREAGELEERLQIIENILAVRNHEN